MVLKKRLHAPRKSPTQRKTEEKKKQRGFQFLAVLELKRVYITKTQVNLSSLM